MGQANTISYDQLKEMMEKEKLTIVDVREANEVQSEGMIPNALHIPRKFSISKKNKNKYVKKFKCLFL